MPHLDAFSAQADYPRLLIVDDDPRSRASLRELLNDGAMELATARNGKDALVQLSSRCFDLVLLDWCLPDVNGHKIMDFVRRKAVDVDVVIISGRVEIDAAIGALERGAFDYLRKPYGQEELTTTVERPQGRRAAATGRFLPPSVRQLSTQNGRSNWADSRFATTFCRAATAHSSSLLL